MKKSLFLLGAAIVALSSCTKDEVLNVNENRVISFESYVNKSTRAVTETETDDLEKFFVYGYYGTTTVFEGIPVTKETKDGVDYWEYNGGVHTPWTGGDYYFGAYASTNDAATALNNVTFTGGKLTIGDYTVNDAEDLVVAWANVNNSGLTNPTVALDFKHTLSKVVFELTNASTENLSMVLTDIKITVNTNGDCSYDGTTLAWGDVKTSAVLTFDGTTANISKGTAHTTKEHLVIPGQTTNSIKAAFTAKFYNGSNQLIDTKVYENVALSVDGNWKPGFVYKYTANVSPTMPTIEFSASVSDWQNTTVTPTLK